MPKQLCNYESEMENNKDLIAPITGFSYSVLEVLILLTKSLFGSPNLQTPFSRQIITSTSNQKITATHKRNHTII